MAARVIAALSGGDRRSIGEADKVVAAILRGEAEFEDVIMAMGHEDPVIAMRASDVVEKVSRNRLEWLAPYKGTLLALARVTGQQEVRWHLAQMVPRLDLSREEGRDMAAILSFWMDDRSRIVEVSALEALVHLARSDPKLAPYADAALEAARTSPKPSVRARARKLLGIRHH